MKAGKRPRDVRLLPLLISSAFGNNSKFCSINVVIFFVPAAFMPFLIVPSAKQAIFPHQAAVSNKI